MYPYIFKCTHICVVVLYVEFECRGALYNIALYFQYTSIYNKCNMQKFKIYFVVLRS